MKQDFPTQTVTEGNGHGYDNLILLGLSIGAVLALFAGWRLFWFMTDDAYIAFRYISNSFNGYGYTWNLPPFRAVEGYTSFLWVVLLDLVWRLTGYPPPQTANVIALFFASGTLLLGIYMVWRLPLNHTLDRKRPWLLLFFLLGVLSNRTFLTWSSSGLETAMFNFFVIAWFCICLYAQAGRPIWLLGIMATAVLAALTRPDGYLLIAASLFLSGLSLLWLWQTGRFKWRYLLAWSPLILTAAHFLWRYSKYGEWLPNTFAAKYVAPWPESGWRYFVSFLLEYALWFWLVLAFILLVWHGRQLKIKSVVPSFSGREVVPSRLLIGLVVMAALTAHFLYYTFIIGGDYFEYRVYSQLIIPLYLSFIWLLNQLRVSFRATAVIYLFYLLLSGLVPWTHWQAANALANTPSAFATQVQIAPEFPAFMRPYAQWFDEIQTWLIQRQVAVRQHQHKAFAERQLAIYPSREAGSLLADEPYPVMVLEAVGVPGWVLPTTNIVDAHGLNDYVVARNPTAPAETRIMAHERYLPVGYADCFWPNVRVVRPNRVVLVPRTLSQFEIVACETAVWPPSHGDEMNVSNLGVDYERTPALDHFLWHNGPAEPLFLTYASDEAARLVSNEMLLETFVDYAGAGCLIIPGERERAAHSEFLFAFFMTHNQPVDGRLQTLFPWLTADTAVKDMPHLGYTAVAGPEIVPAPTFPQNSPWQKGLTFRGYDLAKTTYQPGESINLTLYYEVAEPLENSLSSFSHLLGGFNPETGGPLWGQQDGNPCGNFFALADWPPGSIIVSKVIFPLPETMPTGEYALQTGFYNWLNGERLPLQNGADHISIGTIQVEAKE